MSVHLACPHCGLDEALASVEQIRGIAEANSVDRADDGKLAVDWKGYTELLWETQDSTGEWICKECDAQFGAADLIVAGTFVDEEAAPEPDRLSCVLEVVSTDYENEVLTALLDRAGIRLEEA